MRPDPAYQLGVGGHCGGPDTCTAMPLAAKIPKPVTSWGSGEDGRTMRGRSRSVVTLSAQESAEELARLVIHRVAPEEDEIFAVVSAAARRPPVPGAGPDEVLGFGVDAAVTLLTPVVLGAAAEVVRHLA